MQSSTPDVLLWRMGRLASLVVLVLLMTGDSFGQVSASSRLPAKVVVPTDWCPRDLFEWLEVTSLWPEDPIELGGQSYSRVTLQQLFADESVVDEDASMALAAELAAVRLNLAQGIDWPAAAGLVEEGNVALAAGGALPQGIDSETTAAQWPLQIVASMAEYNLGYVIPGCPNQVSVEPPDPICPMSAATWAEQSTWPVESIEIAGAVWDRQSLVPLIERPDPGLKDPVGRLIVEMAAAELNKAAGIDWPQLDGMLEAAERELAGVSDQLDPCSELGLELDAHSAQLEVFNARMTMEACMPPDAPVIDLATVAAKARRGRRCSGLFGFAELHTHMFAEFGWNGAFIEGSIDDMSAPSPQPIADSLARCSGLPDHASLRFPYLLGMGITSEILSPGDSGLHLFRRNGFDTRNCLNACLGPAPCLIETNEQACLTANPGVCIDDVPSNISLAGVVACNSKFTPGSCQGSGYCGARGSSLWSVVDDLNPCWAQWPNCDAGDACIKRDPLKSLECNDLNQAECNNHPAECNWSASCKHQSGSLTCSDLNQGDCGQYGFWCDWKTAGCQKDPLNLLPFQCNNLSQNDCNKYGECDWAGWPLNVCLNNLSGSLTCSDLDQGDCGQYGFWCDWKAATCKKDPLVLLPFECNDLDQNDCGTYAECGWEAKCKHPLFAPSLECSDLTLAECEDHFNDGGCGVRDCVEVNCQWAGAGVGACRWDSVWPPHCGEHFMDWPAWDTPTHQQHWWGHLQDAWRKGLRIVSASILEADPLAVLMPNGEDRTPYEVIIAQLDAANAFAARHQSWLEIALTADHARQIAESGRLAVVLTLEGNFPFCTERPCGRGPDEEDIANVTATLDEYIARGIQAYQVVSHFDNPFAGVAVYQQPIHMLQWLYDELSGPGQDITELEMAAALDTPLSSAFNTAANLAQAWDPLGLIPSLTGLFPVTAFDQLTDMHALIGLVGNMSGPECIRRDTGNPYPCAACLENENPCQNVRGLTPLGEELVRRLVDRGILIDIAHLSERGVQDVWDVVRDHSITGTYPLYVSHGDPRDRLPAGAHKGPHQEKPTPPWILDIIRDSGGMFGMRTGADEYKTMPASLVSNSCAGSSKSFAQALAYLEEEGIDVGFAVDMNGMIANAAPRFFERSPRKVRKRGEDAACLGDENEQDQQVFMLADDPGTPYTDESRFNTRGLGHIGQLGAFLDDLDAVGLASPLLDHLYSSAEAFIEMWESVP